MLAKVSLTGRNLNIVFRLVGADWKVNALSEMNSFCTDFLLANLQKA